MNNILDKCVFIKCPLKDSCLRFGKKLREGQVTDFKYDNGCKNYFNKRHFKFNKVYDDNDEWMPDDNNQIHL